MNDLQPLQIRNAQTETELFQFAKSNSQAAQNSHKICPNRLLNPLSSSNQNLSLKLLNLSTTPNPKTGEPLRRCSWQMLSSIRPVVWCEKLDVQEVEKWQWQNPWTGYFGMRMRFCHVSYAYWTVSVSSFSISSGWEDFVSQHLPLGVW